MKRYEIEPYYDEDGQRDYAKEEAYLRAKKKLDKIVGFYWHLAVYIIVNIFLICLIGIYADEGLTSFGTYATAIFWGIGLLFHFLGVFGPSFIFGKNWEDKKIREFMDKEKQGWE